MVCCMILFWSWNQDSQVHTETGLHTGSPGNFDLISSRDSGFFCFQNYPHWLWAPPSLSVGTRCCFLGDELADVATRLSGGKVKNVVVLYVHRLLISMA